MTTTEFHIHAQAKHPLEIEAISVLASLLQRARWPEDRIKVHVTFGFRVGAHSHSRSELDVSLDGRRLVGKVSFFFNSLYLLQAEGLFLKQVIPHEVAHALVRAEAKVKGLTYKDHGDEWISTLIRVSPDAITAPKLGTVDFNDAAIRIFKHGAIPALCGCQGMAGFHVVAEGDSAGFCKKCGKQIEPVPRDRMPEQIRADFEYIQGQAIRNARN